MQFRTKIPIKKEQHTIDYDSNVLLIGSCFSENISKKLAYYKFEQFTNPLGILFHPKAIEKLIVKATQQEQFTEEAIFFHNERWHCFDAHSSLSTISKDELLAKLNTTVNSTNQQINKASHIIITLGTAWVYRLLETDSLVANCHKIPQQQFRKKLLSVDEIVESLTAIISSIEKVNSKARIIFTLSPVRHSKDGFVENAQSKAHLLTAIHHVIEKGNTSYFPAYEILMDELRDYRFYAEDMIHPNQTAIAYIWECFCEIWLSDTSSKTMKKIDAIQKGLAHKPFHSESKQHQDFIKNIEKQINELQEQYPRLFFEK